MEVNDEFEKWWDEWLAEMEREIDCIHESERITAEDLAIIVY